MTDNHEVWDRHLTGSCEHNEVLSKALTTLLTHVAHPRRFNPHLLGHLACVTEALGCPAQMVRFALKVQSKLVEDHPSLDTGVVRFRREGSVWTYAIPEADVTHRTNVLRETLGDDFVASADPVADFHTMARLLTAHMNGDTDTVDALLRAVEPAKAMLAVSRQMAFTGMLAIAVNAEGQGSGDA